MFSITHANPDQCCLIPISLFFLFKFIQALLIMQLAVFLNRRTKQKTENTVTTLSHFYQNELDISEYNQSHSQC